MEEILFVGPIAHKGGPAIKNRILVEHLQNYASIKVRNTYDRSLKARLGAIFSILFTRKKYMIVSVSRKGRNLLYPLVLFKHRIAKCKYSCIFIGGNTEDSLKRKVNRGALREADVVTVETKGLRSKMEKEIGMKNVYWMPNYKEMGGRIPHVQNSDFGQSTLRLVFLSSMRDLKGVHTLFSAFKKCREMGADIELDYYGPIKEDLDRTILSEINRTDGVRYCGEVDNDRVLFVMSKYQVFIFPTECFDEGFPAVLVEAQAVGLPVIASDVSYNGEIIEEGVNGYIFPNGDIDQLARRIMYCAEHREELAVISSRNIQDAGRYDAAAVIRAYADELRKSGWPV